MFGEESESISWTGFIKACKEPLGQAKMRIADLSQREKLKLNEFALEKTFKFPSWGRVLEAFGLAKTGMRRS